MRYREAALLILLISAPLALAGAEADQSCDVLQADGASWTPENYRGPVFPGTGLVHVSLGVRNNGTRSVTVLDAEVRLPPGIKSVSGSSSLRLPTPVAIGPRQRTSLEFDAYVTAAADPGTALITLEFNFSEAGMRSAEPRTCVVSYRLRVTRPPELTLIHRPLSLLQGSTGTLRVTLVNRGEADARIVSVQVFSRELTPLLTSLAEGVVIGPGEWADLDVPVSAPADFEGEALIALKVRYAFEAGERTAEFSLPVRVSPEGEADLVISVSETGLSPGVENEIDLTIENEGDSRAEGVHLSIQPGQGITVLGPSSVRLGDIGPGESTRVGLRLLPSEAVEAYELKVEAAYSSGGRSAERTVTLGFYRSQRARVTVTSLSSEWVAGKLYMRGLLANVGDRRAKSVNVTVVDGACEGQGVFLGELDAEETLTFSISCEPAGNETSATLRVYYMAAPGQLEFSDSRVSVPAESPELPSGGSPGATPLRGAQGTLAAVAAVAAAGIGLVIGRLSARAPRDEG